MRPGNNKCGSLHEANGSIQSPPPLLVWPDFELNMSGKEKQE